MISERLKGERKRLGYSQEDFAALAGITRRPYAEWEAGKTSPTAVQLAALGEAGADVQYIVTGHRQGQGIGDSAVHQAVLDAVDLLSLAKKVDAQQLAKAVVKLCAKSAMPLLPTRYEGSQQNFHGPITGEVAGRDIVKKEEK